MPSELLIFTTPSRPLLAHLFNFMGRFSAYNGCIVCWGGVWMQVDFHNYRYRSRTCYPGMISGWFSVPLTYHISAYYGCAKGVAQVDFHTCCRCSTGSFFKIKTKFKHASLSSVSYRHFLFLAHVFSPSFI